MKLKEALQAGNIVVTNGLVGVIMSNNKVYYNNGCFDRVGDFEGSLEERDWGNSVAAGESFEAHYDIRIEV